MRAIVAVKPNVSSSFFRRTLVSFFTSALHFVACATAELAPRAGPVPSGEEATKKRKELTMDNPNANFDDDSLSEEEAGETIRLRPFLDWRVRRQFFKVPFYNAMPFLIDVKMSDNERCLT